MTHNKKWKAYIIPFVFLVSMWSCISTNVTETEISDEKIYKEDDVIPYFPGCENISEDIYGKWRCSLEKAKSFIYENLEYPGASVGKGGDVVAIYFVVDKKGHVVNPEINYDSNGLGNAVIKALQKMPRWIPATKEGAPVHAKRYLPIRIDERQYIVSDKSEPLKSGDGYFIVPQKMAYFTACEGMTDGEKYICNKRYINQYVNSRIYGGNNVSVYTDVATNNSKYLKFQVNKEGNITNIRAQCGGETENKLVKNKLKNMPQWIPAQHNGKSVSVELVFSCAKQESPGY